MADDVIAPEIEIQGGDEAAAALQHLGEVGSQAFAQIIDAASQGNFEGLATLVGGELAGSFTKATEAVFEFVQGQAEAAEQMSNFAEASNMSIQQFQGWAEVFASVGVGVQGFERGMARLQQTINSSWSSIQESTRTAGTEEAKAQLEMQEAALNTQKAYNDLQKTMQSVAEQAENDADRIASAQAALQRAILNQQKDSNGGMNDPALAAAEQLLKNQEDINSVIKARHELEQANIKAAQDEADGVLKIKEAQQAVEKARIAEAEAAEHAYEVDLKNIPKIADELKSIADGYTTIKQHADLADVSQENLVKAVIKMTSMNGQKPEINDVLMETSKLFKQLGDDADAMALKTEIAGRMMGQAARAGMVSQAQLIAVLDKGPEAIDAEIKAFAKFRESLGDVTGETSHLKAFSDSWKGLSADVQAVAQHFAAMMATGLTNFLETCRKSLEDTNGALHMLVEVLGNVGSMIGTVIKAVVQFTETLSNVTHIHLDTIFLGFEAAVGSFTTALGAAIKGVGMLIEVIGMLTPGENIFRRLGQAAAQAGDQIAAAGRAAVQHAVTAAFNGPPQSQQTGGQQQNEQTNQQTAQANQQTAQANQQTAQANQQSAQTMQQTTQQQVQTTSVFQQAVQMFHGAVQTIAQAAQTISQAATQMGRGEGINALGTGKASSGGLIRGPGGPTDDKAGLWALSDGEYVIRNAAVARYGVALFDALNNLALGGFAMGGLVGSGVRVAAPASGHTGASSILNLTIDGYHFNGLRAPPDTARALKSYAVSRQSSSTGRKPSWMR